jgi:hypothetical protein
MLASVIGLMNMAGCGRPATTEVSPIIPSSPIQDSSPVEPTTPPQPDPVLGTWDWGWDAVPEGQEPIYQNNITFNADGTMSEPGGQTGKWERSDSVITISWANGATDTVTISEDGKKLDGQSKTGAPVRGKKR